jgi:hypothetical protein
MKKLILGMVFVFATGTIMNAAPNKESLEVKRMKIDCITMAFAADAEESLSYEQFSAVVNACEATQK